MATPININLEQILGEQFAMEKEQGEQVYELIRGAFEAKNQVVLSFQNIDLITTAFLNSAIGELYKHYTQEQIAQNLEIIEISRCGKISLKHIAETTILLNCQGSEILQGNMEQILENR